jgi:hypothetical protein
MCAVQDGDQLEMARVLLDAGADLEATDYDDRTATQMARDDRTVELLRHHGAKGDSPFEG